MTLSFLIDLTVPPVNTDYSRKWLLKQHVFLYVCAYSLTRSVSPKVPNMQRHKTRSECPLRPTYHRRNSHRSAVNWTHTERRCRPRCYRTHQTELGSGKTDTHMLLFTTFAHQLSVSGKLRTDCNYIHAQLQVITRHCLFSTLLYYRPRSSVQLHCNTVCDNSPIADTSN